MWDGPELDERSQLVWLNGDTAATGELTATGVPTECAVVDDKNDDPVDIDVRTFCDASLVEEEDMEDNCEELIDDLPLNNELSDDRFAASWVSVIVINGDTAAVGLPIGGGVFVGEVAPILAWFLVSKDVPNDELRWHELSETEDDSTVFASLGFAKGNRINSGEDVSKAAVANLLEVSEISNPCEVDTFEELFILLVVSSDFGRKLDVI